MGPFEAGSSQIESTMPRLQPQKKSAWDLWKRLLAKLLFSRYFGGRWSSYMTLTLNFQFYFTETYVTFDGEHDGNIHFPSFEHFFPSY
jgi:hypothetical protein